MGMKHYLRLVSVYEITCFCLLRTDALQTVYGLSPSPEHCVPKRSGGDGGSGVYRYYGYNNIIHMPVLMYYLAFCELVFAIRVALNMYVSGAVFCILKP